MTSLAHALRDAARRHGDNPAVISSAGRLSFAQFDRRSGAVAAALARQGIVKGDRVGLYCPNSESFAIAYVGILKAGAVVVPLNLMQSVEALAFILNDAGAKALIYHDAFAAPTSAIRAEVPSLGFSVCIGTAGENALNWADMLAMTDPPPDVDFDPTEDLAAILYTSGTTGRPKGAMLTHGNLLANTGSVRRAWEWQAGQDVVLLVLPMFHAFAATVGMLTPLLAGCAFAPLPRFEPDLVAQTVFDTKATIFLGVPSMFSVLLRLKPERVAQFESLRFCVSGGAALPVEVLHSFESRFRKKIYEGDGPTECSPVTCVNPVGGLAKPSTVGLPVPGVEMRIVGDFGEELPSGQVGEIAVRGANVMKGYWNLPEDTRESFRDGWFLTGDLGTEDEDGYFAIVDRKKDLIIVNGMNVYPRIIEETLYRFPNLREAAVVGEPHDLHGEIPVAYVALDEQTQAGEAEIRAFCRQHLGRHEVPRRIVILKELPKTATGKILKRELRRDGEVERGVSGLS
ncbi:MAG: long-chain fatty acid CoA ligase [Proteobacteria bacterium]|nr:long-chain fatty acid CoA ligase [Pseudomonadota bacterium]